MSDRQITPQRRFGFGYQGWATLVVVLTVLVFLYFYRPFTDYLMANLPQVRFGNIIFWFTSLVAVVGFVLAHWQTFRQHIVRAAGSGELQVAALVLDTLQIAILTAVIFAAGATLQAVQQLAEYLIGRGEIFAAGFGKKLLAIVLLVILALLFYLLHQAVRAFRQGGQDNAAAPGRSAVAALASRRARGR